MLIPFRIECYSKNQNNLINWILNIVNKSKLIKGINITNKSKDDEILNWAKVVKKYGDGDVDVCVHFSTKYQWKSKGRSKIHQKLAEENMKKSWINFVEAEAVDRVLLVSGSPPKRKFDSIKMLEYHRDMKIGNKKTKIGIAWTPGYPTVEKRDLERKKLCAN